jgi:hypothetical protein
MTTNLLKRLESSIESFRLTCSHCAPTHQHANQDQRLQSAPISSVDDLTDQLESLDADDDDCQPLATAR